MSILAGFKNMWVVFVKARKESREREAREAQQEIENGGGHLSEQFFRDHVIDDYWSVGYGHYYDRSS
jgi:hypothetical protein